MLGKGVTPSKKGPLSVPTPLLRHCGLVLQTVIQGPNDTYVWTTAVTTRWHELSLQDRGCELSLQFLGSTICSPLACVNTDCGINTRASSPRI